MAFPMYGNFENLQVLISSANDSKPHHLLNAIKLINHRDGNYSNKSNVAHLDSPIHPVPKDSVCERLVRCYPMAMQQTLETSEAFTEQRDQDQHNQSHHSNISERIQNNTDQNRNGSTARIPINHYHRTDHQLPVQMTQSDSPKSKCERIGILLCLVGFLIFVAFTIVANAVFIA